MKRFILLFAIAVFTIMGISCKGVTPDPALAQDPDRIPPHYTDVIILPADQNPYGDNPDLDLRYVNLRYDPEKFNNQVRWIITSNDVFEITFDKGDGSPFVGSGTYTNSGTRRPFILSGSIKPDALPDGATEKIFRYTLKVGDKKIDPGVVVHR